MEEIAGYRRAFKSNTLFWVNDIDRRFYSDDAYAFTVDTSLPENYWYLMTLNETERYNFNINYNPDLNVTNLWINAPVFDSRGRAIGMLGTGIDLSSFIDSIYRNYSGTAELYFFNSLQEITGSQNTELVVQKTALVDELGQIGEDILSQLNILHSVENLYFIKSRNVVALGEVNTLGWYITAIHSMDLGDALSGTMTVLFVSMMAVIAAIFFIFCLFISGLLRRSTHTVNHVFKSLEKNDLSVQVEVETQDEFGELIMALGSFLENLKSAFAQFMDNASMVSTAVFDLSASAREITTTANEQSASVTEIVSTMENNKNLSEQIAGKTLEVAELAEHTRELSQHGAELHTDNEEMMLNIRNQNAKIVDEIGNLSDILSRIDESIQLIDTIADHTKLIAFNAALEASSSGEAGTRFAVVAGEIRRFADNVVDSVNEIKDRISDLQSASQTLVSEADTGTRAIDSGYRRMVEQKEVFENIADVSENVAVRSQQISNLSKQQELASTQIFSALKEISQGVKQFVTATSSTSATVDDLNNMSKELKETLSQYRITK